MTASSISNFESEDNLFSERSKLSVKFENAQSHYLSKRFFIDHKFNLFKSKKNNSLYLGHVFEYDTLTVLLINPIHLYIMEQQLNL